MSIGRQRLKEQRWRSISRPGDEMERRRRRWIGGGEMHR
ncbi:hypothetical protein LINPERHAP2_LOCUS37657, partial [Linum perenne]